MASHPDADPDANQTPERTDDSRQGKPYQQLSPPLLTHDTIVDRSEAAMSPNSAKTLVIAVEKSLNHVGFRNLDDHMLNEFFYIDSTDFPATRE